MPGLLSRWLPASLLVAGWLVLVVAGFALALGYGFAPGAPATPPARTAGAERPRIVLCAHPRCPCTQATLEELDRIASRVAGRADIRVLIVGDDSAEQHDAQGPIARRAARIPGVELVADPRGEKARALGAATSGETLLYAADGRLLFHGGITPGRGHQGANAGVEAVVDGVFGRTPGIAETPVFGCSLFDPAEESDP